MIYPIPKGRKLDIKLLYPDSPTELQEDKVPLKKQVQIE